jgi:hypothetical protein
MDDTRGREYAGLAIQIDLAVADFQAHTLANLQGRFCRLIYLASLRDHNTGRYYHEGLEGRYGGEAADEGLRRCHTQVFDELMALPLKAQTEDLVSFFKSIKEERQRLVEAWERLRSYQILPPENCHPLARELFNKDIEIILKVLRETDLWELLHEPHGHADDLT